MKIVIDIPEEQYRALKCAYIDSNKISLLDFVIAIRNGTPLPKRHGRLIDADALKAYFFRPYSNEESYSNIDIEKIIDEQITVKPERKTGTWIHQYKEIPNMATFKCSCCGCVDEFAAKYCSNCGARMEADE